MVRKVWDSVTEESTSIDARFHISGTLINCGEDASGVPVLTTECNMATLMLRAKCPPISYF